MKILMCVFKIYDYGGIINHAEHLIYGLHKLGHEVHLVLVEDKKEIRKSSYRRKATNMGFSGLLYDQRFGWQFNRQHRIPFRDLNWKNFTSNYDLVLWEIPVPSFKSSGFESNWKKLYAIKTPQIAFIHDGNMPKMYPHIKEVVDQFEFLACVHPCALGTARSMGFSNSRLILNPQIIDKERPIISPNTRGRTSIVSLQTFKRWKRVDELIAAVPYLEFPVFVAGGGIEYYYMTSTSVRKKEYGRIWEDALETNMTYLGYISEEERDKLFKRCKYLVDCSWSNRYTKYGSHFNRVMIDAIIKGVKPVLNEKAMVNNRFFDPIDHYVEIPADTKSPEDFACIINKHRINIARMKEAQQIVEKNFKAEVVAKELLS